MDNNEIMESNQITDYTDLIMDHAFIGTYPIESILDGISKQFEDYTNNEDHNNYVMIFYQQLYSSYNQINDEEELHPNEIKEVLDGIENRFIGVMQKLFMDRLTLTITDLESDTIDREDLEFIITRLYEFFILSARSNFISVISNDVTDRLKNDPKISKDNFFMEAQRLLEEYSPLLTTITPNEFLYYRGEAEINSLYDNGRIAGNFLNKYTPKLYQNEDLVIEIMNHITMSFQWDKNNVE